MSKLFGASTLFAAKRTWAPESESAGVGGEESAEAVTEVASEDTPASPDSSSQDDTSVFADLAIGRSEKPVGDEPAEVEAATDEPEAVATEAEANEVEEPQATEAPPKPAVVDEPQEAEEPQDIQALYREVMEKQRDALINQVYAIPQELAEQLDTQPSQVVPQLAASIHQTVLMQTMEAIAKAVPAMLAQTLDQRESNQRAEEAFFKDYPGLIDHKTDVARAMEVLQKLDPKLSAQEAAKQAASYVMAQKGLAPKAKAESRPKPQVPVRTAAAATAGQTPEAEPLNPFAALALGQAR